MNKRALTFLVLPGDGRWAPKLTMKEGTILMGLSGCLVTSQHYLTVSVARTWPFGFYLFLKVECLSLPFPLNSAFIIRNNVTNHCCQK